MMQLFERPISGWSFVVKTLEDRVLAGSLLLLLSPLLLVAALAIKLDSRGPGFFRQKRYGFNHTTFVCWNFRTMHHHLTDAKDEDIITYSGGTGNRVGAVL